MAIESIGSSIAGSVASKAIGGIGGGKGGGGKGGGSSQGGNTFQQSQNFAPFQTDAINQVFSLLGGGEGSDLLLGGTGRDSLLQVPEKSSNAVGRGLDFATSLLGSDNPSAQGLLNFQSLINSELEKQPFNDAIDRFEEIGNSAEGAFSPFVGGALGQAERGVDPRFGNILERFANEDPFSNPFVDRLVGDVSADVRANVIDQNVAAGLESSGFGQQLARETGRAATAIRGEFGERSRNRSLAAAQAGGQFDAANAAAKLNALLGGSNILNQRFGVELGAAQGVLGGTSAQEQRRLNLLSQRGNSDVALANLPLAGLSAIGPLAQQFQDLPFQTLANFAELAFAPLGRTSVGSSTGNESLNPSIFDTLSRGAGAGLTGAGLLDELGLFGGGSANPFSLATDFSGGGLSTPLTGAGNADFDNFLFGSTAGPFGSGLFT